MKFKDRSDAGKQLAEALSAYKGQEDLVVLALPRGGVPVAYEVAMALHAPLDLWLVRKLGIPGQEEVAMGAIATGGVIVLNDDILHDIHLSHQTFHDVLSKEQQELERRNNIYRDGRPAPEVKGKTAILVDDGLATGATMRAAVAALHKAEIKELIVAVPVGTNSACRLLEKEADKVVCLRLPTYFYGVGNAYHSFPQNTDAEVKDLLAKAFLS